MSVYNVDEIVINAGACAAENDPYGQGASWVAAKVTAKDAKAISALRQSSELRSEITVKCGLLEADGVVDRSKDAIGEVEFVLAVQNVRFSKSKPVE